MTRSTRDEETLHENGVPIESGDRRGPLDGVTVVSIEQAIAAPLATRHLADLGARVIKIERPGVGDFARAYDGTVRGMSSHFVWANRSKESITLDLKHPTAAHILDLLIKAADVFVLNLAPGSISRLGLTPAQLRAKYPGLIICRISGYGDSGPYASKKAYDLLVQGEVGLLSITGTETDPVKVGIPVADISAGMYAFSGIVSALFGRTKTGIGEVIEISLLESLAEWMSFPALFTRYGGTPPARTGIHHATIVPYGAYYAGDGEIVLLAVQTKAEWKRFCVTVLERSDLFDNPLFETNEKRLVNRLELDVLLKECFSTIASDELIARLEEANLASARCNDIEDLLNHPQLQWRERWYDVESPVGMIQSMLPPINLAGSNPVMGPIPELGEHTDSVLGGLGFSSSEIANLRANDIV